VTVNILTHLLRAAREDLGDGAAEQAVAEYLARALLEADRDEAVAALVPALAAWVQSSERGRVRRRELAFASGGLSHPNPAQDAMRALLAERCWVPGHGMVPWGELTLAHHRLRVGFLREQLRRFTAGTTATIARHEAAVALLAESGHATLGEYADEYGDLPLGVAETQPGNAAPGQKNSRTKMRHAGPM
jgi:hypothetical protein